MAIEYLGLSSVNGPLVVLEGLQDAFYDEIVEFTVEGNIRKMGRIIELNEDKAVIQVFEGTQDMSLQNTHTRLTGRPMEVEVSPDMLGRTFNGIGIPVDGLGPIGSGDRRDVNGLPLNPVRREYPRNYIRTPGTETADLLGKWTAPRSAGCPDCETGVAGRRRKRGIRRRVCCNGREARCGGIFPEDV